MKSHLTWLGCTRLCMPQASHLSSPSHKILCNEHSNARMLPFFPSAHSSTFRQRKKKNIFILWTFHLVNTFDLLEGQGRIRETLKINLNLEQLREFGHRNCVATDDLMRQLSCTVCFYVQNEKKKKKEIFTRGLHVSCNPIKLRGTLNIRSHVFVCLLNVE